jgi:hypothetical protein
VTEPSVRPGFWRWIVAGLALLMLVAVLLPNHRARPGARSESAALEALRSLIRAEGRADAQSDGYLFAIRRSPQASGLLWMAVARPEEPGVTGDRYFVTNHAGIIYYTGSLGKAFELNDACEIPPNTLPVGK